MDIGLFKDVSIIVAGVIAFITLWTGMIQYGRQRHAERANQFIEMRRRFLENPGFRELLTLIAKGSEEVKDKPSQDRRNLVGFLEEVALLMNSGLIKKDVVHYMFGQAAIAIDSCEPFWEGLDKDSEYWTVFRGFVKEMRTGPSQLPKNATGIRI